MKRIRLSTLLLLIVIAGLLVDRWRLARREEDMKLAMMRIRGTGNIPSRDLIGS
jgi:hypothetical protein